MNKRDIVSLIKKLADDPIGAVPGGKGDVPHPVATPNYTNNVTTMQRALMTLSKAVTSQIKLEDIATQPGQDPNNPQRQQIEAAGRNTFNDFITKMMRASDVPGVEFDPNPKATDMKDKKPSEPTRMGVMMDTMYRVGNPKKGERFDDGDWGPRTNAALRNAYAFAFAMLKLSKDFGLKKMNAYDNSALAEFAKIPQDPKKLTPQQKSQYAAVFTEHINDIIKMYNQIKVGILEKPAYQEYIEGRPYDSFQKGQGRLDDKAVASLQKTYAQGFPVKVKDQNNKDVTAKIFIKDLLTPEAFQAWSKASATSTPVTDVVAQIKSHVAHAPLPVEEVYPTAPAQQAPAKAQG